MGRLIDADVLIDVIKKYKFGAISNESEREYTREIMLCFVNGSPTAYDVEKVVAELEENGQKMSEAKGNPWDSSDHKYYKAISVKKAIEIVKKGGVE